MSENFGERLKSLRKGKRLTQVDLAKVIGSSSGYISEIESGSKKPGSEMLVSLAKTFGVTLDHLVNGEESHVAEPFPEYAVDAEAYQKAQMVVNEVVPELKSYPDIQKEMILLAAEEYAQLRSLGLGHGLKTRVRRWVLTTRLLLDRKMKSSSAAQDGSALVDKPKP